MRGAFAVKPQGSGAFRCGLAFSYQAAFPRGAPGTSTGRGLALLLRTLHVSRAGCVQVPAGDPLLLKLLA